MTFVFRFALIVTSAGALAAATNAPPPNPVDATAPTYNKDIAPILYQNCATCHRPGEVAPFSLLTYRDTAKRAALIATVTKGYVMPPWKPQPGYGDFRDARRLTDEQIAIIQRWASNGAPEGDSASKSKPPAFTDGWQLGQPDKVVTIPSKFSVPPDGADQYRCFVIPLNLDKDAYVNAMEFRPDDRRTVHHALVFADPMHQGRKLAEGSPDGGYTCFGGPVEGYSAPDGNRPGHPNSLPSFRKTSAGSVFTRALLRGGPNARTNRADPRHSSHRYPAG